MLYYSSCWLHQTLLTFLEPMPFIAKQDACVSAVMPSSSVGTHMDILSSTSHSDCQTMDVRCDAASSASPNSATVGTDVDALCPTSHCEAQTDSSLSSVSVASGDESFVHVTDSEMQTKSSGPSRRDAAVTAVASSRCVATDAGSFLNIASSVTQTESCASQDATTATTIPVSVAVATSVDALFNMAHSGAQTVSYIQRDAMTHAAPAAPASATIATDVDALFTTSHSAAQTTPNITQDATTITVTPSSTAVATNVDSLFNVSHAHSQTTPSSLRDAATTAQPLWTSAPTDVDVLFSTSRTEVRTEPLIPSQVRSPLQIVSPTMTFDTQTASASDLPDGGILISPFREALDQSPKIVDVTNQPGTNVDKPETNQVSISIDDYNSMCFTSSMYLCYIQYRSVQLLYTGRIWLFHMCCYLTSDELICIINTLNIWSYQYKAKKKKSPGSGLRARRLRPACRHF